ncbi:winged helix-turn-helix domain-containing protein [Serratia marcescens]|uniref:winged helix-turn-helix domain-containing protein n=1 Tax=Serratia marcescens TaxID=615 RepID=UPI0010218D56|nr:helix-turn-helix domain-containing protein [Serratia marcescens]RZF16042.1 hypothetical protein B7L32_08405 [Serratia marcescens]
MKYIINLTIIFEPESKLLLLRNNNQLTVGLSNPATRLLNEFIKNNKIELTREDLIKRVWEDYGFSPSSATLSNHISELRKAFETLGVSKNILITVPRIGFKMEAEIHPETKEPGGPDATEKIGNILSSHGPAPILRSDATSLLIKTDSDKHPVRGKLLLFLLTLSLITIAITITLIALPQDDKPMLIGVHNQCKIYTLNGDKHGTEQLDSAKKILTTERIDCTKTDFEIYYMEARPTNNVLKVNFIAACTKNDNSSYKNCNNYKFVE